MHAKLAVVLTALIVAPWATAQDIETETPAAGWWLKERPGDAVAPGQRSLRSDPARMLSVLVYTRLSVDFEETPARDAIAYLRNVLGIDLIGRFRDERGVSGIDPEAPITLHVIERPAIEILELVLAQCEDDSATGADASCTWQLRRGFIEVGTRERLSRPAAMETRTYLIRDLMHTPPWLDNAPGLNLSAALNQGGGGGGFGGGGGLGNPGGGGGRSGGGDIIDPPAPERPRPDEQEFANRVVSLIQETIEPDAWVDAGGHATVHYVRGVLIVRAPDYIHRQIGGYPFRITPALAR